MNGKNGGGEAAARILDFLRQRGRSLRRLLIVTHDHPDPDGLASAWVLAHLAHALCRTRPKIVYGGVIGRRENRKMFERLEIPAYPISKSDLDFPAVALIDTQPPFKNNRFPERRRADLIVDHHPRNEKTQGDVVVIDESVGATATIMTEALLASGVPFPNRIATAILYGIGSETQNLGRDACGRDIQAYTKLMPRANFRSLWHIANPPRPASFFQTLARAIRDAFVCRRVIGVHLRELPSPDRVAQMADFLLTHEKMTWSIVTGRYDGHLHVSLRTSSLSDDAGRLMKSLLGGKNRGGGHRRIAGGSLRVGQDASEEQWRRTEEKVVAAFLATRNLPPAPEARVYPFRS